MLVTQIISAMTVTICMLVDSIMISRFLGVDSMTAYMFANPVLLVFAAVGSMLSAGIQVVCGKAMGIADREKMDACYSVSMLTAAVAAGLGLLLVLVLSAPLATLLGAGKAGPENEIHRLTQDYLRGFIIGAPAFIFAQIMVPFLQIGGKRVLLVSAVLAMTVSDVVFDILNVFVFRGGTFGMGFGSSLSYYVAFAVGITYFLGKKCMFRLKRSGIRGAVFAEVLRGGIPTVINQISLVALVFLVNRLLMKAGGGTAVASYSVISTIGNLCYCFGSGTGAVSLTLSAFFYHDEDRDSLIRLVRIQTEWAAVLNLLLIGFVEILAVPMVSLFTAGKPEVTALAARGLRIFSISLLSSALNTTFKNYYQGVGHERLTEVISVFQNFVFTALYALVLGSKFGTDGIFWAFSLGETTALILWTVLVWILGKKAGFSLKIFAFLPAGFGVSDGESMNFSIHNSAELSEVSEKVEDFCRMHGDPERDCVFIALCVEEMAANVLQHGFTKDRLNHSIHVRLVRREGERILRLRDNCVNFDPVDYMKLHDHEEDPTAHIGIRMVMKMVKEANYQSSLGLNSLTLVL